MGKFVAKLTGESDGLEVTRHFEDKDRALTWLQGAGLSEFEDQAARGEVISDDGNVVWTRSHLQTPEGAEQDRKVDAHRLLARVGLAFNKRR